MKTYKQTLFISIVSALLLLPGVSKVHAAGTIHFFLSGAELLEDLQSLEYSNKDNSFESEGSYGILLDFTSENGHALALDYYSFSEEYDDEDDDDNGRNDDEDDDNGSNDATGLLVGYRYHSPSGFYLGGGIMSTSFSMIALNTNNAPVKTQFKDFNPLALTLGYQTAFSNGLSLGTHLLYSLPEDLEQNGVRANDFSIQSVGFIIGYAWGGNS